MSLVLTSMPAFCSTQAVPASQAMAELVATAAAAQIARSANDITRACLSAGVAVIAREGISPSVLGFLAASTADLLPNISLIEGLTVSRSLEGTWNSPFMANFMGLQKDTTQQALLSEDTGKKLVIYATALAGAATPIAVRGILREHLAVTMGLPQVAEVPENMYHVCVHSPTLQLLQQAVMSNLERCIIAFSETDTKNSREASYRELSIIAKAFGRAQKQGPKHWVRVKNLIGAEALCAALGTAFIADITIGSINAIVAPTSPTPTNPSTRTNAITCNQPGFQYDSPDASALAATVPTSIHFEYDSSGIVAIGLCEAGAPIRDYIVPEGGAGRPLRGTMPAGEILALAKITLDKHTVLPWICKGAIGAFEIRNAKLAEEMVEALTEYRAETCQSMTGNLVGKWMETFVRETGGTEKDGDMMRHLLVKASTADLNNQQFVREIEMLAGPDHATTVSKTLQISSSCNAIDRTLVLSLLKTIFGLSYSALELKLKDLDYFSFTSTDLRTLIPRLFGILSAYDVPVTTYRTSSVCCSVVQCGGYVLMPRILAEEKIGDIDSSPFIMVPGQLAKNGVPVNGFFYDEQHGETHVNAIRPEAPVPSNAGDCDVIHYIYEEADFGYRFRTVEAGHNLNLDGLIEGILSMHKVDDFFADQAGLANWECAAPHHMVLHALQKTVYLSYGNVAGRRLALSRAGDAKSIPVVHTGRDFKRAMAYANQYGCGIVVL